MNNITAEQLTPGTELYWKGEFEYPEAKVLHVYNEDDFRLNLIHLDKDIDASLKTINAYYELKPDMSDK